MKVVLDTNVLISGIYYGGKPARIVEAWLQKIFELYASEKLLAEYLRLISEFDLKRPARLGLVWKDVLEKNVHQVKSAGLFAGIVRDPKDDMLLDSAQQAKAGFLVSGDLDILSLKGSFDFKIMSPSVFIENQLDL